MWLLELLFGKLWMDKGWTHCIADYCTKQTKEVDKSKALDIVEYLHSHSTIPSEETRSTLSCLVISQKYFLTSNPLPTTNHL